MRFVIDRRSRQIVAEFLTLLVQARATLADLRKYMPNSEDRAVRAITEHVLDHLEADAPMRFQRTTNDEIDPPQRELIERAILFLQSDLEYTDDRHDLIRSALVSRAQWLPLASIALLLGAPWWPQWLNVILLLVALGCAFFYLASRAAIPPASVLRLRLKAVRDWTAWPFLNEAEHDQTQRLFKKSTAE